MSKSEKKWYIWENGKAELLPENRIPEAKRHVANFDKMIDSVNKKRL